MHSHDHLTQVGVTQNDCLYILMRSEHNAHTAMVEYTWEELVQCQVSMGRGGG